MKAITMASVIDALHLVKNKREIYTNKISSNINVHKVHQIVLLATTYISRRTLCNK